MLKINIIKGDKDAATVTQSIQFEEARQSLSGDFLIFDHDLMDIVVSAKKSKVVTFPKDPVDQETYTIQERFLKRLARHGVLDRSSIKSGSVHSSLEGDIEKSAKEEVSPFQVTLLEIYNFLQDEQPDIEARSVYKKKLQNFIMNFLKAKMKSCYHLPQAIKKK